MYDTVCYSQQAQWRTISGVSAKYVGVGPKKNQKDDENPREFHFPLALRNHNRNVSRSI